MNPKIDLENRLGEVEAKALIQFQVGFRTSPFCFIASKQWQTSFTGKTDLSSLRMQSLTENLKTRELNRRGQKFLKIQRSFRTPNAGTLCGGVSQG